MEKLNNIALWITIILFIATAIGWAYDSGIKSAKITNLEYRINELEKDNEESIENISDINLSISKLTTIVEFLTK